MKNAQPVKVDLRKSQDTHCVLMRGNMEYKCLQVCGTALTSLNLLLYLRQRMGRMWGDKLVILH